MIHHPWVDGAFDEHATSGAVPNIPPIVEIEHAYDNASNRLTARDARPGNAQANRDSLYSYDGLDRLSKAERGVVTYNGGSGEWEISSYSTGSQSWSLDMLGNWSGFGTDTTGDGAYTSANEQTNRYHNDVNELTGIDLDDDDSSDITLTYDAAGNLRERPINASGASERYTHDLWNRLVKVETYVSSTWYSIGEYEYYGTHWRSVKRADTDSDQTLDEKRELYYSAGWQLLEERVDDDYISNAGINRHLQYLWGLRYIDDVIWHREDTNGDEDFVDGGDERWWHLTDTQFSTVALLDDGANLQERVKYDAYGKALHHRWRDVDGDRDYDASDRSIVSTIGASPNNLIGLSAYRAEADLDRDGVIDSADLAIADTSYESALAPGVLSDSTAKNTIGWDGYVFNPETTTSGGGGGLYTVRFRTYSTELGRWVTRDPAGYADGMNSYGAYFAAYLATDPFGLRTLSEENFKYLVEQLGLTLPEEGFGAGEGFNKDAATRWIQNQLNVPADGDFGSGAMHKAMRDILDKALDACKCCKVENGDDEEAAKTKLELYEALREMAAVMFGEFGTHSRISAEDFKRYAEVVGWSIQNRLDNPRYPGLRKYKDVIHQKHAYQAVQEKTPAYLIAQYALGISGRDAGWNDLARGMHHNEYVKYIKNLKTAIEVACKIICEPDKQPKEFRGLVLYYSPEGMDPPDSKPKWKFEELEQMPIEGVLPELLKPYRYKE